MAIKVCDAIMGSGKSSAAINYMNENPHEKFIYITPYLEEAERIRDSCPKLQFKEPSSNLPEYGFRKYKHTFDLISNGENITSTHNMFLRYSDDMIDIIKEQGYILIIDEAVDVLRKSKVTISDVKLMEDAGWVERRNGVIKLNPTFDYQGGVANEIVSLSKGNRLIDIPDKSNGNYFYYWLFSKDILLAFKEVIILTYLFEAQTMKYYLDLSNIGYSKIGINKDNGNYNFSEKVDYIPEYTKDLSSKIHIFDNDKINSIGKNKNALSSTWFKRNMANSDKSNELKNNVYNYFTYYNSEQGASARLWATYKSGEKLIRGAGFTRRNIAFNTKATNKYRSKQVLAYCVNIFMQPNEKCYLVKCGVDVREDTYALSIMIQWIWRSAIREGKEIWIYIPSKRMRDLLKNWIEDVENFYIHKGETV